MIRKVSLGERYTATLPVDVDRAAGLLEASLGPPGAGDDLGALRTSERGLAGWAV